MLEMSEIKLGRVLEIDGAPYVVQFTQHIKVARSGATLRTKLKNLITGQVIEKSFNGGDKVDEADIQRRRAAFLYADGDGYHFMDGTTYEQFSLTKNEISEMIKFLKEGLEVDVLLYNNKPVTISLPTKVEYTVTEAPPGVRGDSAGSVTKQITLENGLTIQAPMFINSGDKIRVNTETGEYVERV